MYRLFAAAWLVLLAAAPAPAAERLTLSIAISLKDVVEELGRGFTQAHPGVALSYNFGSSGELSKQIEAGAPVDVFVSAGERQMDELAGRGLLVAATRRVVARNVLVVVKPSGARVDLLSPADLAGPRVERVVVGNPRTVPVGQYAEESLRALGVWDGLRPRLVFAENVRQALDYVARGEVDAGVVYATDVAARPGQVIEAFRLPEASHRPIVYPAAVIAASRHQATATAFLDLLGASEGRAALGHRGFLPALTVAR
jgi:molybdate transport system substrate-binding protein